MARTIAFAIFCCPASFGWMPSLENKSAESSTLVLARFTIPSVVAEDAQAELVEAMLACLLASVVFPMNAMHIVAFGNLV